MSHGWEDALSKRRGCNLIGRIRLNLGLEAILMRFISVIADMLGFSGDPFERWLCRAELKDPNRKGRRLWGT
jgi:hypothetical protein